MSGNFDFRALFFADLFYYENIMNAAESPVFYSKEELKRSYGECEPSFALVLESLQNELKKSFCAFQRLLLNTALKRSEAIIENS